MTDAPGRRDLVVLVADKNMEFAVKGILARSESLAVRQITHDVYVHVQHDPGCLGHAHDFLRPFTGRYEHAIVMFDREGCGRSDEPRERLEERVTPQLASAGWGERAETIVIDPELENWVWSDSPQVANILGWTGQPADLADWLTKHGFLTPQQPKPIRPKEAMEATLRFTRKARSSALYLELARRVSFERCADPAFSKLKLTLRNWFPPVA